jgi:hypothetical protein
MERNSGDAVFSHHESNKVKVYYARLAEDPLFDYGLCPADCGL